MGLSSVAAIALSAIQAQSDDLSETADDIANAEGMDAAPDGEMQSAGGPIDVAELTDEEQAYRASAAAFETGADLWALLNAVSRD